MTRDYHRPIKKLLRIFFKIFFARPKTPSFAPKYADIRFLLSDWARFGWGKNFRLLPPTLRINVLLNMHLARKPKGKTDNIPYFYLNYIDKHFTCISLSFSQLLHFSLSFAQFLLVSLSFAQFLSVSPRFSQFL